MPTYFVVTIIIVLTLEIAVSAADWQRLRGSLPVTLTVGHISRGIKGTRISTIQNPIKSHMYHSR